MSAGLFEEDFTKPRWRERRAPLMTRQQLYHTRLTRSVDRVNLLTSAPSVAAAAEATSDEPFPPCDAGVGVSDMPQYQDKNNQLKRGDFYEGCSYHPCMAVIVDYEDDEIAGVSLVDGTFQSCSLRSCGVLKLSQGEALTWKFCGPQPRLFWLHPEMKDDPENGIDDPTKEWEEKGKWWNHEGKHNWTWWDPQTHDYKKSK